MILFFCTLDAVALGRGKHSSDSDQQQLSHAKGQIKSHQPLPQRVPADTSNFCNTCRD